MTILTDTAGYITASPLTEQWSHAARHIKNAALTRARKIADSPLTKAFTKAAMGAGCIMAFKSAAVGLAGSFGASAALGGVTAGTFITGYQAIKDYRAQDKQRPQGIWNIVKDFFCFLGENKWKYTGKLLKNSGAAALGGTALLEFLEMLAPLAHADDMDDDILTQLQNQQKNPIEATQEAFTQPEPAAQAEPLTFTESTQPAIEETLDIEEEQTPEPQSSALDKLAALDRDEFSGRAAETLSYAEKGHDWAVKEMAIHLLSSNNGSPLNRELAVELLQIAEHSDNPKIADQASKDLDIIRKIWPEAFMQEEIIIAETAELEAEPKTATTKTTPAAPAPEEHIATAETPSTLERLAALNPDDFGQRGQYVLRFAEKGHGWALNEMASSLLYEGNGSPQNRKLAVELYRLAQETGNADVIKHATADLKTVERLWGIDNIIGTNTANETQTLIADAAAPQELPMPELPTNTNISMLCNSASTETGVDLKCTLDSNKIKSGDFFTIGLPGGNQMEFYYDEPLTAANDSKITESGSNIVNLNLHFSHEAMQNPEITYSIIAGNDAYGISFSPQSEPPI
ncbi:MAG: hypothetical protein KDI11_09170, partial [Alphaproteobacteria bacterium]|nr:hypothetical protein [Alphaproteobacteria bacterium]